MNVICVSFLWRNFLCCIYEFFMGLVGDEHNLGYLARLCILFYPTFYDGGLILIN